MLAWYPITRPSRKQGVKNMYASICDGWIAWSVLVEGVEGERGGMEVDVDACWPSRGTHRQHMLIYAYMDVSSRHRDAAP